MNRQQKRAFARKAFAFMEREDACRNIVDQAATHLRTAVPGFVETTFAERREVVKELWADDAYRFEGMDGPPAAVWLVDTAFGLPVAPVTYHEILRRVRRRQI